MRLENGVLIDESELVERFVRSSGPGGQNVNKVSSAVELRFDIVNSPSLSAQVKDQLLARSDRRITQDGILVIQAQRFRTQERNREDARERLAAFIVAALKPRKPRLATKPSRASRERRLEGKRQRAQTKSGRTGKDWD